MVRGSTLGLLVLNNTIYYFLLACLIIFAGTRLHYVGTDTEAYYRIFETIANDGAWFNVHYYEPLYVFLNAVVAKIGLTARELILLAAVVTLVPLFMFFKRTSSNYNLSIVLYMSIFGYLMIFNGVRQSIAIAFFVWFVYFYYQNRYMVAVFFGCLSVSFHYTAAVAIVAFFVFNFFSPIFIILLYLTSLPFLLSPSFSQIIFNAFFAIIQPLIPSKYAGYVSGLGYVPNIGLKDIFNQAIFILSFYFLFLRRHQKNFILKFAFLCSMLSVLFFNYFYYIKYFDRIALYFYVFNAISLPLFILSIRGDFVRIAVTGILIVFSLLLLTRSLINGSNGITSYASWVF